MGGGFFQYLCIVWGKTKLNYSKYIIKQLGLKKEKQILKHPSLKKYHPSFISFNLNGSNKYVYKLRSPNFRNCQIFCVNRSFS